MAITIKELRTEFTGDTRKLRDATQRGMKAVRGFAAGASKFVGRIVRTLKRVGFAAVAMAATIGGAATAAIASFAKIERKVTEVGTLLDKFDKQTFSSIKGEAQSLARQFGQTTDAILGAKYDIVSSGFTDAAESANVLNVSLEAATAGLVDANTAASLVVTGLKGYQFGANRARWVSDTLFTTVKLGRTTFGELAAAMGNVIPVAKSAGVSFEELNAAMATVTIGGIDTTTAATALARLFTSMAAPSEMAADAMREMGIQTKDTAGNLLKLEQIVAQFKGKSLEQITKLAGDARSAKAVMALANNFEVFKKTLAAFNDVSGATETAFKKMADTISFKYGKLKQVLATTFQDIGEVMADDAKGGLDAVIAAINERRPEIIAALKGLFSKGKEYANDFWETLMGAARKGEVDQWIADIKRFLTMTIALTQAAVSAILGIVNAIRLVLTKADEIIALRSSTGDEKHHEAEKAAFAELRDAKDPAAKLAEMVKQYKELSKWSAFPMGKDLERVNALDAVMLAMKNAGAIRGKMKEGSQGGKHDQIVDADTIVINTGKLPPSMAGQGKGYEEAWRKEAGNRAKGARAQSDSSKKRAAGMRGSYDEEAKRQAELDAKRSGYEATLLKALASGEVTIGKAQAYLHKLESKTFLSADDKTRKAGLSNVLDQYKHFMQYAQKGNAGDKKAGWNQVIKGEAGSAAAQADAEMAAASKRIKTLSDGLSSLGSPLDQFKNSIDKINVALGGAGDIGKPPTSTPVKNTVVAADTANRTGEEMAAGYAEGAPPPEADYTQATDDLITATGHMADAAELEAEQRRNRFNEMSQHGQTAAERAHNLSLGAPKPQTAAEAAALLNRFKPVRQPTPSVADGGVATGAGAGQTINVQGGDVNPVFNWPALTEDIVREKVWPFIKQMIRNAQDKPLEMASER